MSTPTPYKINEARPKYMFKGLNRTLRLTIRLGMKSGAQLHYST